jgi:hypothetical protein
MKNIHVLPTDKPSRLIKDIWEKTFSLVENFNTNHTDFKAQHIYITSDEEIKEGDWFIAKNKVLLCTQVTSTIIASNTSNGGAFSYSQSKKIILTTNQDLIKDGVQPIDDEFLEWFVKNPSCEYVEVDKDKRLEFEQDFDFYEIIIPKEEEPKQKTLEEAAKKYVNGRCTGGIMERALLSAIEFGAKWQQEPEQFFNDDRVKTLERGIEYLLKKQERSYSEEEVFKLIEKAIEDKWANLRYWFEQFKKK